MATLAPTISHIQAANRSPELDLICAAGLVDDGGTGHGVPRHSMAGSMDDCGYCNLFAHMPVMPAIEAPSAAMAWVTIEHRKATRFESVRRSDPLTSSQPRAPPALS